jgi:carboxyl-terminal processing protease
LEATESFFGPYSTEHHRRLEELIFLTRVPANTRVEVTFQNPDEDPVTNTMRAEVEYDSMFAAIPSFSVDEMELPVYGEILDDSGLGYIRVSTFSDDYNLIAQLWDRYIKNMIELGIPGLIIDIRVNGGGSSGLANNFAGYFYETEEEVSRRSYYNNLTGGFEVKEPNTSIEPAPVTYPGDVAVIVSPYCISACEGFAYALSRLDQVSVIGHYPTSGAFGEVGRGQYDLPAGLSMQFPTGRSETPSGDLLIEGSGVEPDIMVPVTYERVLGDEDALLQEAIDFLLDGIN